VHGKRRVPVVPALTAGAIGILILSFNINNPKAFTIIISMGIILMYIAYLGVTTQLFRMRRAGWPDNLPDRHESLFRLGRWALITNGIAVVYGLAMVINLMWPREEFYGTEWYQQWGPILIVPILLAAGLVWWYAVQQHRGGVLEEHRAELPEAPT
jgi:amino acid transporter